MCLGFAKSVGESPRQLKGFTKFTLRSGASRRVSIDLDRRAFSWWSTKADGWVVTPGRYEVWVGSSSRDLPLRGSITQ